MFFQSPQYFYISFLFELQMIYEANFGIDCDVSSGFGVKYSDYISVTEKISADSPTFAMKKAINRAAYFSNEYLSNPDSNLTTVKLLCLKDPKGEHVNQLSLNKDSRIEFEQGCAVIKCSSLEHMLLFRLRQ